METRVQILATVAPSFRDSIVAFYNADLANSISPQLPGQPNVSSLRVWNAHDISKLPTSFILHILFPIFSTLVVVVVYALGWKLYFHLYPEPLHVQQATSGTARSENERTDTLLTRKRVLTLFEFATGAQLERRFWLVADYETCRFIKGMKFASADGIYTTGFVVANKKYLLQTHDFWSILLMKLLRRRFRNIYVYEVSGSTVQQTARLVHPDTLSFADLANINVC